MTRPDLAMELVAKGKATAAVPLLRRRAKREPSYTNLIQLGVAQRSAGQILEAMGTLKQCLEMDQMRPDAWNNMGQCYTDMGRFTEAPNFFQRALQCVEKQNIPLGCARNMLLGFAYSMMRLGQFEYIWPVWEAARHEHSWTPFPHMPVWRGQAEGNLLVLPEGGYGDAFLFSRFLPITTLKVTVLLWPPLVPYMQHMVRWTQIKVLPLSHEFREGELAQFNFCTSLLSLISYSGIKTWKDLPPWWFMEPPHTIKAPPNNWIGFCWHAEENGVTRRIRSLDDPTADKLAKVLGHCSDRVISLCPGKQALYRKSGLRVPHGVVQDEDLLDGWEQTARTILKCRHVVTVDTAIAHLAGSLGVPTTVLLPRRSDWKWGADELPPWYGPSFSCYRNQNPINWDVDKIRDLLWKL